MNGAAVLRGVAAAAEGRAAAAIDRAARTLAARAAERFPALEADAEAGRVRLRGSGLLARAFGSRRRAADPRLAALVIGDDR